MHHPGLAVVVFVEPPGLAHTGSTEGARLAAHCTATRCVGQQKSLLQPLEEEEHTHSSEEDPRAQPAEEPQVET